MPYAHHLLLHFPIALGVVAALFAALAWARPDPRWTAMARALVYLTLGSAVAAATTGLLSAGHLLEEGADASNIELHRNLALAGVGAWAVAVALTWRAARAQATAASGTSAASDKLAYAATVLAAGVVGLGATSAANSFIRAWHRGPKSPIRTAWECRSMTSCTRVATAARWGPCRPCLE